MISCTFENGNKNNLRHVVVDILVLKEGKILLVKRTKKLLEAGKWAVVGGFVERDETLAEAARREVTEETGWEVTNIQPLFVQDNPNRPHEEKRQNIAFVYTCDAVKKTGEHDWEEDDVQWFDLDNLPDRDEVAFDHYDHIQKYLEIQKKGDHGGFA